MTRYLVYTTPGRGHLYPIMPTLLELQRRGHSETADLVPPSQWTPVRQRGDHLSEHGPAPLAPTGPQGRAGPSPGGTTGAS